MESHLRVIREWCVRCCAVDLARRNVVGSNLRREATEDFPIELYLSDRSKQLSDAWSSGEGADRKALRGCQGGIGMHNLPTY